MSASIKDAVDPGAATGVNRTDIVHFTTVCADCGGVGPALCGAPTRGESANDSPVDCAVCEEIGRNGFPCASCERWVCG